MSDNQQKSAATIAANSKTRPLCSILFSSAIGHEHWRVRRSDDAVYNMEMSIESHC
jgi:hypothetical protein